MIRVLLFDQRELPESATLRDSVLFALVAALVLAFPVGSDALNAMQFGRDFVLALAGLAAAVFLSFAFSRLLGSNVRWRYFGGRAVFAAAASLAFTLLLSGVALLVDFLLKTDKVSAIAFSLLPFYSFALYGWASDESSGLEGSRKIAAGLAATALFVLMHFGLEMLAG